MTGLVSYAQNFEDIILWRAFSHVPEGCYIDIGAQSPDTDSVSRLFYENGWRGIHIEPMPQYTDLLRARRHDETVLQAAVDENPGVIQFYGVRDTGLSTTDQSLAEKYRERGFAVEEIFVPAVTLDEVLELAPTNTVHWLKIDVEGAEKRVIDGWRESSKRPWVIVIESTRPLTAELSYEQWEPGVLARGYTFAYFDGLNRFYVSDEHPELKAAFGTAPNVFDDFSLSPHSQFCALINISYHALELEHIELQQQLILRNSENEILRVKSERQGANSEGLAARLEAAQQEAHRWWLAHDALIQQIDTMFKDVDRERQAAATDALQQRSKIVALIESAEASARELNRWRHAYEETAGRLIAATTEHKARESEFAASINALNARNQQELTGLTLQIEEGKNEAHRWWLAHEVLLNRLNVMEHSKSWRWSRPLRTISCYLRAQWAKMWRAVRDIISRVVRIVLVTPWLHRALNPVMARLSFLRVRLHALAVRDRLYQADQPLEGSRALVTVGNKEHEQPAIYLDRRATRVLAALKAAKNEKGAQ